MYFMCFVLQCKFNIHHILSQKYMRGTLNWIQIKAAILKTVTNVCVVRYQLMITIPFTNTTLLLVEIPLLNCLWGIKTEYY